MGGGRYGSRHDHRQLGQEADSVQRSAADRAGIPAVLQHGRQHRRRPVCRQGGVRRRRLDGLDHVLRARPRVRRVFGLRDSRGAGFRRGRREGRAALRGQHPLHRRGVRGGDDARHGAADDADSAPDGHEAGADGRRLRLSLLDFRRAGGADDVQPARLDSPLAGRQPHAADVPDHFQPAQRRAGHPVRQQFRHGDEGRVDRDGHRAAGVGRRVPVLHREEIPDSPPHARGPAPRRRDGSPPARRRPADGAAILDHGGRLDHPAVGGQRPRPERHRVGFRGEQGAEPRRLADGRLRRHGGDVRGAKLRRGRDRPRPPRHPSGLPDAARLFGRGLSDQRAGNRYTYSCSSTRGRRRSSRRCASS